MVRITIREPVLVFGGPRSKGTEGAQFRAVTLSCPDLGVHFPGQVDVTDVYDGVVTRVEMADMDVPSPEESARNETEPGDEVSQTPIRTLLEDLVNTAAGDWVKNSPGVARDYAKSMIGVCTGAIPVFFAVLKFVYGDKALSQAWTVAGLGPPVAFLAAALAFVLALKPRLLAVSDVDDLITSYQGRHRGMNQWNTIGTVLFLVGVGVAIVVWLIALRQ